MTSEGNNSSLEEICLCKTGGTVPKTDFEMQDLDLELRNLTESLVNQMKSKFANSIMASKCLRHSTAQDRRGWGGIWYGGA